jgi:uncharacterized Zn-finger protein
MTDDIAPVWVDTHSVACDGGGGALGHPLVYLAIDKTGQVECPYCSRLFVYRPDAPEADDVMQPAETADVAEPSGLP